LGTRKERACSLCLACEPGYCVVFVKNGCKFCLLFENRLVNAKPLSVWRRLMALPVFLKHAAAFLKKFVDE